MGALALQMATPLFLSRTRSYCGSNLCKFAMRLKIVKGNIPVVTILPDLPDLAENKVFLKEFLPKEVLELLRLVRARAKTRNYERVWE